MQEEVTRAAMPADGSRVPGWLPNAITVVRMLLIPVFLVTAAACEQADTERASLRALACLVLVALGVSDVVDGWLARRFALATELGAVLDAVADRLAQVALTTFFTFGGGSAFSPLPPWFFGLLVVRDLLLLTGWLLIRRRRGCVQVKHEHHGKLASFLIFGLLLGITLGLPAVVVLPATIVISGLVVLSTFDYAAAGWRQFRRRSTER